MNKNFFVYNNICYGPETVIELKKEYFDNLKYLVFDHTEITENKIEYIFYTISDIWNYSSNEESKCYISLTDEDLVEYIKFIPTPLCINPFEEEQREDNRILLGLLFGFIGFLSMIFTEFYLIWIILIIVFFKIKDYV